MPISKNRHFNQSALLRSHNLPPVAIPRQLDKQNSQFLIHYEERHFTKTKPKVKSHSVAQEPQLDKINLKILPRQPYCPPPLKKLKPELAASQHSLKDQRPIPHVPIEYMEDRDRDSSLNSCGRVTYRGYAAKNTYFYVRTVKEHAWTEAETHQNVNFTSKFESGNLNTAVKISSREYWLYMREDTNTHGLRQWFCFEVKAMKAIKLKIRIYRFSKKSSLYRRGLRPFMKSSAEDWAQKGNGVTYELDSQQRCYYLQFEHNFAAQTPVLIATLPTYTHSELMRYLAEISLNPFIKMQTIGSSLAGFQIPGFSIRSRRDSGNQKKREAIVILGRTHPGETVSNFTVEGIVEQALRSETLLARYVLFIVPMVNPDGVFMGNHRTGVLGRDLNRHFGKADPQYFPEIDCIDKYIAKVQQRYPIALLLDLHGHSSRKNIFAFGEQQQLASSSYLASRTFLKLLSLACPMFKYSQSEFEEPKTKANTARVYLSRKFNIQALTLEQSYGLTDIGSTNIADWKSFGRAIVDALMAYGSIDTEQAMRTVLCRQIEQDQAELEEQMREAAELKLKRERQAKRMEMEREAREKQEQVREHKKYLEQFMRFQKKPTEEVKNEEQEALMEPTPIQEVNESDTSGDEALELNDMELEALQRSIQLVGAQRDSYPREVYSMAAQKLVLQNESFEQSARLHHKREAVVPRIIRAKAYRKDRQSSRYANELSGTVREKSETMELPSLWK